MWQILSLGILREYNGAEHEVFHWGPDGTCAFREWKQQIPVDQLLKQKGWDVVQS